jgi:hypothetical protein
MWFSTKRTERVGCRPPQKGAGVSGVGDRPTRDTFLVLLALSVIACALSGCATSESEIPWNAPQSWEGTPAIPGLSQE